MQLINCMEQEAGEFVKEEQVVPVDAFLQPGLLVCAEGSHGDAP